MEIDLNIDNYNFDDILSLFHLTRLTSDSIKSARQIAFKMHPDKSGLSEEYFFFFLKAYKILLGVYKFRIKSETEEEEWDDIIEEIPKEEKVIRFLKDQSPQEFNKWFNKMFEQTKITDEEHEGGYGDWLRSDEDINGQNINNMSEMSKVIDERKQTLSTLSIKKDVQDISTLNNQYGLGRDKPEEYSATVFSKLHFNDLKKTYTETVVPVTHADFQNTRKYNDVNELKRCRDIQNTKPLSLQQSKQYLSDREISQIDEDDRRAYNMIKQSDEAEKSKKLWWKSFNQLTNK